jgi:hypothetical protein
LRDTPDQNSFDLEVFSDFLWVVFFPLEAEGGAARHDFDVRQARETADQAFGNAIAQVFIAGVGCGVDKWQNSDGYDLACSGSGFSAEVKHSHDDCDKCKRGCCGRQIFFRAGRRNGCDDVR